MRILKSIWNAVRPKTDAELRDEYLGLSKDHGDLERRLRHLENGNLRGKMDLNSNGKGISFCALTTLM